MATYRYDFTMALAPAGQAGQYPMDTGGPSHSTTYMPDTNIIFKQGDTIQVRHTHPLGNNINYAGSTAVADPDPTVQTSQSGTPSDTTISRTLTWGSAYNLDYYTKWFFFSHNNASPPTNAYTTSIIFKKVSAGLSVSASSVSQGGALTFTGTNITGITPSGTNGNRLYLSVFNSSNTLIQATDASGLNWANSSSGWLGKVDSTNTTCVLTTGSSLPVGTYTVYLTHYNNATRLNGSTTIGNRFMGSEQRLASTTFSVTTAATGPTAFDSALGVDGSSAPLSNPLFSQAATISGMANPSSQTVTASGDGSPKVSINGGSYVTSGTVSNGQTVQLRFNASNSYSTTHTATLTIRGVTGSVSGTTIADPGTSGGGTSTSGATAAYGLEILNASGTTIFGPNFRSAHVIATGTWSTNANSNSVSYSVPGMTASNRDTIGLMVALGATPGTSTSIVVHYGTNSFYIQNITGTSRSGTYVAIRY